MLEAFEGIVVLVHRFKDGENQLHMSSRKENILALTGVDVNFCNKFSFWSLGAPNKFLLPSSKEFIW